MSDRLDSGQCRTGANFMDNTLTLVPIERFFLRHDRAEHAMVFRVLLQFTGGAHRPHLETAFETAIQQQPLLTSLVRRQELEDVWERAETLPQLQWESSVTSTESVLRTPIPRIDLRETPGLVCRVWPVQDEEEPRLMVLLDIHHACCDGQGARQFLFDWFINYDRLVRGEPQQSVVIDRARLKERGDYRTMTPPIGLWEGLRNLFCTVRGRSVHLPERKPLQTHQEFLSEQVLSIEETSRLRIREKSGGIRLNDAGLTAAFGAFAEVFTPLPRRQWITLLHPVDLRWPSDLKLPACNRVGVSFLRRRVSSCQDLKMLQQALRDEMNYIKRRYVGAEFLRGLAALEASPGLLNRIERGGWFTPSLQFTCLGNVTRMLPRHLVDEAGGVDVGGLKVHHIAGFMQRGPRLPISLTACETHQRLSLTARISLNVVEPGMAQRFFDRFVELFLRAGDV